MQMQFCIRLVGVTNSQQWRYYDCELQFPCKHANFSFAYRSPSLMTCCCSSWVTLLQTRSSLPEFLRARESSLRNQVTIPASKLAAGGGAVCHVYPTRPKGTMCFLGKVQLAMRCTITTAVLTNQVPQKKYNQRHNQRIFDPCNCSQIQLKYSMPKSLSQTL